jgi:murein DD-endopeptidase MepM/ murein hydrolase activator NlpD
VYVSGRPIKSGWLSSYYGTRKDPFTGSPAHHKGIDFAGKQGDDVIATGSGIISWAGDRYGYGQLIEIDHGNGYKTRYGHNDKILVAVGEVVDKGQQIAQMGSSGRSTGPHVHYEILRSGKQINPLKYVYRKTK